MTTAESIIAQAKFVVLDFDGPVCRLFPPPRNKQAAATAKEVAVSCGAAPEAVRGLSDHLQVLRWAENRPDVLPSVTEACRQFEIECAMEAIPVPETAALIQQAEVPVSVLSNNHADAVAHFLTKHSLEVNHIYGRPYQPSLMKPHPGGMHQCIQASGYQAHQGVFIGDAQTDIDVANIAGIPVIGLNTDPDKLALLQGADAYAAQLP